MLRAHTWSSLLLLCSLTACTAGENELTSVDSTTQQLCLGQSNVEGIDVSYYQQSINWSSVAADGVDFAIARATSGTTYVDSTFQTNWSGIKNAGLIRGAYHYFYGDLDGVTQANHFLSTVGAIGNGDLPLAVDIEYRNDQYSSLSGNDALDIANLHSMLETLEQQSGRTPMIYTNVSTWNELGNPTGFEKYPLWAAAWSSCSLQPAQLPDLKVWQYSATGSVSGIAGDVDLDLFNGTLAELQAFANGGGGVPSDMVSLGGSLSGPPALSRNLDGRLQVFAVDSGDALVTIAQTAPNSGWGGWQSLGGVIVGEPTVARAADGRLEVFVRGVTSEIWRKPQTSPGGGFGAWESLGGYGTSDPTACTNWDDRIEMFVVGSDGLLYHRYQLTQNGAYANWEARGSLAGGGIEDPVAITQSNGLPAVFARGQDDQVYLIKLTASGWTNWISLGGSVRDKVAVGINQDGRMEVFARGAGGDLLHNWETTPGGSWSGWSSLGGGVYDPAVASNADGRLAVFVRGMEGQLYRKSQTSPGGGWGDWISMGGSIVGGGVAGQNQDGRLEAFVTSTGGDLLHDWQSSPGTW